MRIRFFLMAAGAFVTLCRAEDAAALYKARCASCHGASGAGKPSLKGSNLLASEVRNRTDDQLAEAIAKGGPNSKSSHAYEKKGVTRDQVSLLVQYVRDLQNKSR